MVFFVEMSRGVLIGLLLIACGPRAADDGKACGKADVDVSGALVDTDRRECDPCPRDASFVLITLETTCEPGIEWQGPSCLIDLIRVRNLATQEESTIDLSLCTLDNRLWMITSGQPIEAGGTPVGDLVNEPGNYEFVAELRHELESAEFDGTVQ